MFWNKSKHTEIEVEDNTKNQFKCSEKLRNMIIESESKGEYYLIQYPFFGNHNYHILTFHPMLYLSVNAEFCNTVSVDISYHKIDKAEYELMKELTWITSYTMSNINNEESERSFSLIN